jgi:hypothetical protein
LPPTIEVRVTDNEKSIKVSDFRMFTPDGELKPEFRDLENATPEPPGPAPPERPEKAPEPGPEGEGLDAGFVDLLRSLASTAYSAMGMLAEPGRKAPVDLAAARRMIDWIGLLERKTRNNLSFAEQSLISRLLYELRMAYVEATGPTRPSGPASV